MSYYTIIGLLYIVIPLVVTVVFTLLIAIFIIKRSHTRRDILQSAVISNQTSNTTEQMDHLTKTLVCVAITYLVCLLPSAVNFFIWAKGGIPDCSNWAYFTMTADTFATLNSSINFFINFNLPAFKKNFKELMKFCGRSSEDNYAVSTNTSSTSL